LSLTNEDIHEHEGWNKTTFIACLVCAADVVVLLTGIVLDDVVWSIAGVGLITFFGMLIISSYHAIHHPDSKGTMRKALAGSLVAVYVVILSLSLSGRLYYTENVMVMILVENFSVVIITIIGFYFGTKGATEFLKMWKTTK
jgi:tellurite resistance protein TehA-like permease